MMNKGGAQRQYIPHLSDSPKLNLGLQGHGFYCMVPIMEIIQRQMKALKLSFSKETLGKQQ